MAGTMESAGVPHFVRVALRRQWSQLIWLDRDYGENRIGIGWDTGPPAPPMDAALLRTIQYIDVGASWAGAP